MSDELKTVDEDIMESNDPTLAQLSTAFPALKIVMTNKFPQATAIKFVKLKRWLDPILDDFTKRQQKEFKKRGGVVEDNQIRFKKPEDLQNFNEQIETVSKQTVPLPQSLKLSMEDLKDVEISAADLDNLICLVDKF